MTGPAVGGWVVGGAFVGDVLLEISADEGQTWAEIARHLPMVMGVEVLERARPEGLALDRRRDLGRVSSTVPRERHGEGEVVARS